MDNDLASQLVGHGVKTLDDLGELATDDLVEMTGIDEERASSLIMKPASTGSNNQAQGERSATANGGDRAPDESGFVPKEMVFRRE